MHAPAQFHGLTSDKVLELRERYGYNEIVERRHTFLTRLFKRLYTPISLMMEIAVVLSLVVGQWEDALIIAILLTINLSVDLLQEGKATAALDAIKKTLAPTSTVLRNGTFTTLPTRELVPGDVVKLNGGDVVPADSEILDDETLIVDQSTVTGESLPVERCKGEDLFASAIVQKGSALVRVAAIGVQASIGKSLALVDRASKTGKSDFEQAIFAISRFLIVLSLVLASVVLVSLIVRGDPWLETVRFVLVLIVASIPVALPTVLSVTMALGARKLAERKAVVSNLRSIEALAGVDELCVDKTGTLTENKLAVEQPLLYGAYNEHTLLVYALLASDDGYKSPVERAVYAYAQQVGVSDAALRKYKMLQFTSFDPRTKDTRAEVQDERGRTRRIIMGAPQVIAESVTDTAVRAQLAHDIASLAEDGFKTLAVSEVVGGVTYAVGLIPLIDPPREDAKEIIAAIKHKGVTVHMVTGDSLPIARYVARILGIGARVSSREDLARVESSDDALGDDAKLVQGHDVFAEVTPEDKYHIVETLQARGHLVAMTGDGVNDAPALKRANMGIAVSGATDAARSAADIVLFDSSLSVINVALGYARVIFARMQSYATFRISETIRIIFFVAFSILAYNITPVTAVMVILLALINDIPVMAIAYDNALESTRPVRWHLHETLTVATVLGIAGLISSFALLSWLLSHGYTLAIVQTAMFLKLNVSGHSTLYLTRTHRKHFWERPWPALMFLIPALGTTVLGTLVAYYGIFMAPLSWSAIVGIWCYALAWFFINDYVKVFTYRLIDRAVAKRVHFFKFV